MALSKSQEFRKTAKEYASKYFGLKDDISAGKYFESMMSGFMMAYVQEYNKSLDEDETPVKTEYDKTEDFVNGTDLKFIDKSQVMLFDMKVLRIDPTANMRGKKEMPIITKAASSLNIDLSGTDFEIRYGIRIGNNDHAFSEPVVVMGLYPKDGHNDTKITKSQIEDAMSVFWNTEHPEQLVGGLIDNAVRIQSVINDLNIGEENNDISELMINDKYIERESKRQSMSGTKRRCGSFITKDGKLVLDSRTGEPKWYRTSELWMTNSAHNVMITAKEIARQDNVSGKETMAVIDGLINEHTRDDIDPPMMQISAQIIRYYEEKDMEEKMEHDFAESVYSLSGSEGPVL